MKYIAHPAVYKMRNGRLAFVQRAVPYGGLASNGKTTAVVLLEGHQLNSDRLLMWTEDGRRVPTRGNREHSEDLIRKATPKQQAAVK